MLPSFVYKISRDRATTGRPVRVRVNVDWLIKYQKPIKVKKFFLFYCYISIFFSGFSVNDCTEN